ncbi:2-amino-4-hydroxy-6-hydroxymethyldihydropteridine diphosphokinase [Dysgonomonas massiliensis]|uniref:2-amino-4-hydroxy-6- hydroxymethyldihydropteridine diphosphokinase n=1 Tax=Dysgonomonas massiliensis TaxID=2040292 RepID=UPI000C7764F4|nr:2-amino-4-hydroxy-6-hydroxymethyldihydropteridine diphosphokinase [Dysgonomonas massiliensis]
MNKVLISIGSNFDSNNNIISCRQLLDLYFEHISYSEVCETVPYGKNYKHNFLNQLAIISTEKELSNIKFILKSIEKKLGRDANDKETGLVKIDVDLVIWNQDILKPKDISRAYVKSLLSTFSKDTLHDTFVDIAIF